MTTIIMLRKQHRSVIMEMLVRRFQKDTYVNIESIILKKPTLNVLFWNSIILLDNVLISIRMNSTQFFSC